MTDWLGSWEDTQEAATRGLKTQVKGTALTFEVVTVSVSRPEFQGQHGGCRVEHELESGRTGGGEAKQNAIACCVVFHL